MKYFDILLKQYSMWKSIHMQILKSSIAIVNQIIKLCDDLTSEQYSISLDLLMKNSIGMHVRHIIEFFDLLKASSRSNLILNYDKRERCVETETNKK